MTTPNPWADFLEEEPGTKAAYFSYGDQFGGAGGNRRQRTFYQDGFTKLYNEYLGRLGSLVRGKQDPSLRWQDYLGGFNFDDYYRDQVPYGERNQGRSNFVPPVRWDVLGR